jgi:hypothetical protein
MGADLSGSGKEAPMRIDDLFARWRQLNEEVISGMKE